MGRLCLLLTATCLFSFSPSLPLSAQPVDVPVTGGTTAVTGAQSLSIVARGDSSSVSTLRAVAVNNVEEWRALVPSLTDRTDAGIMRAPVDFARQTIVAVFQGNRGDGGRGIQVERVTERPSTVVILTTELVTQPNCPVPSTRTPYEIVVIPKTSKRIEIDTLMEYIECH